MSKNIAKKADDLEEKIEEKVEETYEDWVKKIRQASGLKDEEEKKEEEVKEKKEEGEKSDNFSGKGKFFSKFLPFLIFAVALAPRIYFIFFASDPQNAGVGWYNDSYHHWQIGYLTKEIGLGKEFLRLWDLSGMEYFWGLLHPLVLSFLFTITGTADILVIRIFNSLVGSMSAVLLFLLARRHFGAQVGLAAALFAVFNPIGLFTDTSGMEEPLAIFLMLSGIYFWPKRALFTGFFWALASLTRAEYWLFSMGLIFTILLFDRNKNHKFTLILPYGFVILLYLKYLLDKTGNAIYPIYWNFLGNAAGEWQADIPLTSEQESVRIIFLALLLVFSLVSIFLIIKKPRLYIFSLLGAGNFIFLGSFVGLTEYLKSYVPRFWVDRIFWLPYMWFGFVLAIILLYFLPKYVPYIGRIFGWVLVAAVLAGLQLAWFPIRDNTKGSAEYLKKEILAAGKISAYYEGGSILIPGNDPIFTYGLYKNGIKGNVIRGQMFDPFYYMGGESSFARWGKNRKLVFDWLKKEDIRLIYFDSQNANYKKLVEMEAGSFTKVDEYGFEIYKVKK